MIIAVILVWLMCAVITYGIIKAKNPDEIEGEEVFSMFMCLMVWPFLLIFGIGYLLLSKLSKLGEFVAGFINSLFSGDKER